MFIKLDKSHFSQVAPLFASLDHNLSIAAVLEGTSKGWCYCDRTTNPKSTFIGTMEGYFLAGESNNPAFNSGVRQRIQKLMAGDTIRPNTQYLEFEFSNPDWISQTYALFGDREPLTYLSRHYRCNKLEVPDWRDSIPSGFCVRPIDKELLHNTLIELDEGRDSLFHPYEWALGFGSIHNYLTRGFGFAVMDGNQMVSWSMSDCVANNHSEIGIYTMPAYRRQGFATIAANAAVEYCFNKAGFETVSWHCNDDNTASQRTAEKVGFILQKTYTRHYIVRPEWRYLTELGLRDFHKGDFENCVNHYHTAFKLTNEAENYIYHLAAVAAGKVADLEQSLIWLKEAAKRGWKNHAYTESRNEFESLKYLPEWDAILKIMRKNDE